MKHCKKCDTTKPLSSFNKKGPGLQSMCKDCNALNLRADYAKNREAHMARNLATRKRKREWIRGQKDVPCMDCGNRYPYYVMQFDHRDPTLKSFTLAKFDACSWKSLKNEVAKCDVVCANCHAIRTHLQRQEREDRVRTGR